MTLECKCIRVHGGKWLLNIILHADDTKLLHIVSDLQKLVKVLDRMCKIQMQKTNVNLSKVMMCERSKSEAINFDCPNRVKVEWPRM